MICERDAIARKSIPHLFGFLFLRDARPFSRLFIVTITDNDGILHVECPIENDSAL